MYAFKAPEVKKNICSDRDNTGCNRRTGDLSESNLSVSGLSARTSITVAQRKEKKACQMSRKLERFTNAKSAEMWWRSRRLAGVSWFAAASP